MIPPPKCSTRGLALLTACTIAGMASGRAQTGLLVVAHGGGAQWNARVRQTVTQVRWPHGPVALAFLMGEEAHSAGWDTGVDSLLVRGAKAIVVVPLLVSSHGAHFREIEYYAGRGDTAAHGDHAVRHRPPPVPTAVAGALDAAVEVGRILAERWRGLDSADRRRPILLVAHGPSDDAEAAQWIADLTRAAAPLGEAGHGAPLRVGLLRDDAAPPVRAAAVAALRDSVSALTGRGADSVVVFPVLISSGPIDQVKIPQDLEGLPIRYIPVPLAPSVELAGWIVRAAASAVSRGAAAGPR